MNTSGTKKKNNSKWRGVWKTEKYQPRDIVWFNSNFSEMKQSTMRTVWQTAGKKIDIQILRVEGLDITMHCMLPLSSMAILPIIQSTRSLPEKQATYY